MNEAILLVDDEPGIRNVVRISLADMGYRVLTAQNGAEALDILEKEQPAIVLTDIKMPGMDGIALLGRVKAQNPEIEVILFTGHGDMDLAVRGLRLEAADFITKPINVEILEIAIRRAGEKILLRRQLKEYTRHLEQLVTEKAQKLIAAEKLAAVGQTVANLSHTIKNITGGLKGGIYLLEKGIGDSDTSMLKQGFQMVSGNVDKITELSMDLLNYGKYMNLTCRSADPNQPAQEVADLVTEKARQMGIVFDAAFCPELGPVSIDPGGIHCCLLNLVTNAVDACLACETQKEKKISLNVLPCRGWGVAYQVVDTGCGMDEETKRRLFNGFFSTKGSGGTGIGLMLTKTIIDMHQGEIQWVSEKDKGTAFTLRLPKKAT